MKRLFKQFSFPGGIASHVARETPGSIHEGGELGYSLAHGFGAVLDNPDLIATVVVGDGEAETGPLATSWHGNKFLNPVTDGVVLPILHLNGYKISNPTLLSRIPEEELRKMLEGCGWKPYFVEGDEPMKVHRALADTLDTVTEEILAIRKHARETGDTTRPDLSMIVLRTRRPGPARKTWTASRSGGQLPRASGAADDGQSGTLPYSEQWLRSYHPEELFDKTAS